MTSKAMHKLTICGTANQIVYQGTFPSFSEFCTLRFSVSSCYCSIFILRKFRSSLSEVFHKNCCYEDFERFQKKTRVGAPFQQNCGMKTYKFTNLVLHHRYVSINFPKFCQNFFSIIPMKQLLLYLVKQQPRPQNILGRRFVKHMEAYMTSPD